MKKHKTPGRPLSGDEPKKGYSITLEPWLVERIKKEFNGNLSLAVDIILKDWLARNSDFCRGEK